jgi:hypothetical protein
MNSQAADGCRAVVGSTLISSFLAARFSLSLSLSPSLSRGLALSLGFSLISISLSLSLSLSLCPLMRVFVVFMLLCGPFVCLIHSVGS